MTTEIEAQLDAAIDMLRTVRGVLRAEISDYPAPIAGCDAQFNHLLATRKKVLRALDALEGEVFVPTPRSPTPSAGVESR